MPFLVVVVLESLAGDVDVVELLDVLLLQDQKPEIVKDEIDENRVV